MNTRCLTFWGKRRLCLLLGNSIPHGRLSWSMVRKLRRSVYSYESSLGRLADRYRCRECTHCIEMYAVCTGLYMNIYITLSSLAHIYNAIKTTRKSMYIPHRIIKKQYSPFSVLDSAKLSICLLLSQRHATHNAYLRIEQ